MVSYRDDASGVGPEQLVGFFEGWPNPPSPQTHLRVLQGSTHVALALDDAGRVVGFATAISDGVLSAYLSLLEVLPTHREQGIGRMLVQRILAQLDDLYAIGLHCDAERVRFYERLGMQPLGGMGIRHYSNQSGRPPTR